MDQEQRRLERSLSLSMSIGGISAPEESEIIRFLSFYHRKTESFSELEDKLAALKIDIPDIFVAWVKDKFVTTLNPYFSGLPRRGVYRRVYGVFKKVDDLKDPSGKKYGVCKKNHIFFSCLKYVGRGRWKDASNSYFLGLDSSYQTVDCHYGLGDLERRNFLHFSSSEMAPKFKDLWSGQEYFMKNSHFQEAFPFSHGGYLLGHFCYDKSGDYTRSVRMLEAAIHKKEVK